MAMNLVKLPTGKSNLQLRVSKGHYATSHSHINYYIDVTLTKFRLSEARAAAAELVRVQVDDHCGHDPLPGRYRGHRRLHGQ